MHVLRRTERGGDGPIPGDRGGIDPFSLFFLTVTSIGLVVTVFTAYLVMRGPFFGGSTLKPVPLLGALFGFMIGIILLSWGSAKAYGVGARF
ncbi:MAG: hypothetical protein ABEJ28_01615 [Salinigranum sp.]